MIEGSWNVFDLETGLLVGGANSRRRSDRGEVRVVNLKHEDPEGELLKISGWPSRLACPRLLMTESGALFKTSHHRWSTTCIPTHTLHNAMAGSMYSMKTSYILRTHTYDLIPFDFPPKRRRKSIRTDQRSLPSHTETPKAQHLSRCQDDF